MKKFLQFMLYPLPVPELVLGAIERNPLQRIHFFKTSLGVIFFILFTLTLSLVPSPVTTLMATLKKSLWEDTFFIEKFDEENRYWGTPLVEKHAKQYLALIKTELFHPKIHGEVYHFDQVFPTFGFDFYGHRYFRKDDLEAAILTALPPVLRSRVGGILTHTLSVAEKYQVDPFWILAIMWTESHFDHSSVSPVGAQGLMQIMPQTGRFVSGLMVKEKPVTKALGLGPVGKPKKINWENPHINVEMGVYYLKHLLEMFDDNIMLATVAYNMGPYRIKRRLRNGLPVGKRNRYLNRVREAYRNLTMEVGSEFL